MIIRSGPTQFDSFSVMGYIPSEAERGAIGVIVSEREQWDGMPVNVTTKVQYIMNNVWDKARRYYAGVFDSPYDEVTGDRKVWVPLIETAVESVKKSIDFDTKDVLVSPTKKTGINFVPVVRASIFNLFKKLDFKQLLNEITDTVSRDGTCVVKTYIDIDPNTKKKVIKSKVVDLMNIWVEPSAPTLQESSVIERQLKTKQEMEAYKDLWDNIDKVQYTLQPDRLTEISTVASTNIPYTEVWERWGLIPKSWATGKKEDQEKLIEGHIVASGVDNPTVIHLIRANPRKDGRKPYEECWYRRLPGRWPGRGIPEMLFGLQEYSNEVINTRRANNKVLQNGIFLIRKGSGITPDMLNAITAGGGLPVTNINNDIKQLNTQDFRQSSYTDEDRIQLMADRVSGAFDINRGEVGRASVSATATLARDRNIRDTFILVQENIGFFIERLIRFQYIPYLKETLTEKDIIKITGDADYLAYIDEQIVNNRRNRFINDNLNKTGFRPEQSVIDNYIQEQGKFLKSMGKNRFSEYFRNMFDEEVDIEIHITDEKFNRTVAVQQLRDMLISYSRLEVGSKLDVDAIMREMLNIMGIRGEFFLEKPQLPLVGSGTGPRLLKEFGEEVPSEVTAFENASGLPQQQPPVPQALPIPQQSPILQQVPARRII